jgi:head-tail adaptor
MHIGEMRTLITLQKKVKTSGVYAQAAYVDFAAVYCKWVELNSVEVLKNESLQGFYYAVVTMRGMKIDATFKVKKNGEIWTVLGPPKEIENGRFIEIKVQREVAG